MVDSRLVFLNYVARLHADPLPVAEALIDNKVDELSHFAVRLNLSHVLLDRQVFTFEQTLLFQLVHIERGKRVFEKVRSAVVIVPLNHDVRQRRCLLRLLYLILDGILAEVVWKEQDLVVVSRLEDKAFGNHVPLREVVGAHGPFRVALESVHGVSVAILHSVADITLKHREHLQELAPNLVRQLLLLLSLFVLFAHFLEHCVGRELDLLRVVNCLFLANGPVEVNVLLLQRVARPQDFFHQKVRVLQRLVVLCEHFVFKNTKIISGDNLARKRP